MGSATGVRPFRDAFGTVAGPVRRRPDACFIMKSVNNLKEVHCNDLAPFGRQGVAALA